MLFIFEPGTYSIVTANGSAHLVSIDATHLVVFDHTPTTVPIKGTLRAMVLSSDSAQCKHQFEPALDENKRHHLEGHVLHYETTSGRVIQVELTRDTKM